MKWISVNEKLPQEFVAVLISFTFWKGDPECVNIAFYHDGDWYQYVGSEPIKYKISAWMPLPEPYKGE